MVLFFDKAYEVIEKRRRDSKLPNFCFTCNGSGKIKKPISEWDDAEHEYHSCPRNESPTKTCPECNGTGKLT